MRRFINGLAVVVIVLAVVWLGGWWLLQTRLEQLLAANIAQTNKGGSAQITYDRIQASRSPLVAAVTLINPHQTMTLPDGATIGAGAASLGAHIDILSPLTLHMDWPATVNFSTPRADGAVTIASADVTARLAPDVLFGHDTQPVRAASLKLAGISLLLSSGSLQVATIDALRLDEDLNPRAGKDDNASRFDLELNNFKLAPLFARLVNLPFNGAVAHIGLVGHVSGPPAFSHLSAQMQAQTSTAARNHVAVEALHQWALAQGSAAGQLNVTLGPSQFTTSGNVAFDAKAQPAGSAEADADHLDQFTDALTSAYPQLQGTLDKLQAQLSPYLTTTDAGGQVLKAHVDFGPAGVVVNGQKREDMPPLDWDKLLNPPAPTPAPAPPVAPGDGSGAAAP